MQLLKILEKILGATFLLHHVDIHLNVLCADSAIIKQNEKNKSEKNC